MKVLGVIYFLGATFESTIAGLELTLWHEPAFAAMLYVFAVWFAVASGIFFAQD